MTALYIIGGALSAVMWLGLIYVMVVEPVRRYRHGTRAEPDQAPLATQVQLGRKGGSRSVPTTASPAKPWQ
jgi:hypothetical protein